MAKSITRIDRQPQPEPNPQAEAVDAGLNLLTALHQHGVLSTATAAVEQSESLLEILVNAANHPQATSGIKTLMALAQGVSHLDTAWVAAVMDGAAQGTRTVAAGDGMEVSGLWDLLRTLRDPDVAAGLGALLTVVKGIGAGMRGISHDS